MIYMNIKEYPCSLGKHPIWFQGAILQWARCFKSINYSNPNRESVWMVNKFDSIFDSPIAI
jgi:hypothetical protein